MCVKGAQATYLLAFLSERSSTWGSVLNPCGLSSHWDLLIPSVCASRCSGEERNVHLTHVCTKDERFQKYQWSIRSWPLLGTVIIFLASVSGNLKLLMKIWIKQGLSILFHVCQAVKYLNASIYLPSWQCIVRSCLQEQQNWNKCRARQSYLDNMEIVGSNTVFLFVHWSCLLHLLRGHISHMSHITIIVRWA